MSRKRVVLELRLVSRGNEQREEDEMCLECQLEQLEKKQTSRKNAVLENGCVVCSSPKNESSTIATLVISNL